MSVSIGLQVQVQEVIQQCLVKILGEQESNFLIIPLSFRTNMEAVAALAYRSDKRIEINEPLFLQNKKEFLNQIIPHEVAHVCQDILYPAAKRAHGKEWKKLMGVLGKPADTYHQLDVSSVAVNTHRYSCACSAGNFFHTVHKARHKKILEGAAVACVACKTRMIYHPKHEEYGVK